ncbi:MAG TPA: MASE1 domain-containing protein, partial [Caulobacteraceae bacterium]|nr:MASE1 domain-containing protein [Caulobacteraceae bacterium]
MNARRLLSGPAAQALALALLVCAMTWLSITLSAPWRRLPPIWLPNAVSVAFLLRTPLRRWPLLLAASLAGNFAGSAVLDRNLVAVVGLTLANVVESALCAWATLRLLGGRVSLARYRHILTFCGIAVFSAAIGATMGSSWLGLINHVGAMTNWLMWSMADALGLIVLT